MFYQGQIIGGVIAETTIQAQRAARAMTKDAVKYEELERILTIEVSLQHFRINYSDVFSLRHLFCIFILSIYLKLSLANIIILSLV